MRKNDFLARQQEIKQTYLDIGIERGMQSILDYVAIALNDPDLMGKDVWGQKRLKQLNEHLKKIAAFYEPAFSDDVDADYKQELLDRALKDIYKDDFDPFYKRYPYFKKTNYKRGKRAWK